jgi:hypothetical protein
MRQPSKFKPDTNIEGVSPEDVMDQAVENRHIGDGEITFDKMDETFPVNPSYAEIFENTPPIITNVVSAGTFYPIVGLSDGVKTTTDKLLTDPANGKITVKENGAGVYNILAGMSFAADKGSTLHFALHINGVIAPSIQFERDIANINDVGAGGMNGLVNLSENDVIDVRVTSSVNATAVDTEHYTLNLIRVEK